MWQMEQPHALWREEHMEEKNEESVGMVIRCIPQIAFEMSRRGKTYIEYMKMLSVLGKKWNRILQQRFLLQFWIIHEFCLQKLV